MATNHYKISKGLTLNPQASEPSSPTNGDIYYDSTLGKFRKYENGAWSNLGSGSGSGINYIDNPDFEVDASGYSAYADAAAATPVDGTGGSPNVTITRSTSSPLRDNASGLITKDAANRQGQGVGYAFSIDAVDQAKSLTIAFDYEESANFLVNGGTAASPSDIMMFLYDVTNATLIYPLLQGFDASGRFVSTFQTASNSTSYRLIFHIATTNANAWTFKFDNLTVGPSPQVFIDNSTTDWQSYTPTMTGFGTVSAVDTKYRRVGDSIEVAGSFTSGTVAGTQAAISLPAGLAIDTAKVQADQKPILGFFFGSVSTTATAIPATTRGPFVVTFDSAATTTVAISQSVDLDDSIFTPGLGNGVGTSNTANAFRFIVPISGWSTGKVSAVALDSNRPVAASYALTSSTANASFADGASEIIDFDSRDIDTHGAVTTGASFKFTCPVSGIYRVSARFGTGGENITANDTFELELYKNNVLYVDRWDFNESEATASNINHVLTGTSLISLNAGDTVHVQFATAGAGAITPSNTNRQCAFDIEKVDVGSPLAALTETVAASLTGDPASATAGNPIILPTITFDTHGAYNNSTGLYTTPITGLYHVTGALKSSNTGVEINIYVGGVSAAFAGTSDSNGEVTFSGYVRANAGETISIRPDNTFDASATTRLSIVRIR